jgi:uncharacterized membrane protein YraQ (UPF0718 family)
MSLPVARRNWDKVFATVSWILVGVLFYAAFSVWAYPPSVEGPVAQLLNSVRAAEWFYCVLYATFGTLLAWSKIFKKKKMRKHVLLAIYLVGIFTGILTYILIGFGFSIWDNLLTAGIAGFCWLYWTFKTEYIRPKDFAKDVDRLKD